MISMNPVTESDIKWVSGFYKKLEREGKKSGQPETNLQLLSTKVEETKHFPQTKSNKVKSYQANSRQYLLTS